MSMFDIIASEVASILLFFYAIHRFSKIIMRINIHKLKYFMSKLTKNKVKSLSIGIVGSAFMQSNKAIVSIALTLVNTGIIPALAIIPIMFGAPIGASSTSFLVSCKFKSMEEMLIIAGAILKKTKHKNVGHIIFYLGLLLFSLELMTNATASLKDNPIFQQFFTSTNNHFALFVIGMLASAILQSGALVISMITILVSYGVITLEVAICLGIGIVIGSTLALIVVSLGMNKDCRKITFENIAFLTISSLICLLFVPLFVKIGASFENIGIGFAVANLVMRILVSMLAMVMFYIFAKYKSVILKHTNKKSKMVQEHYNTNIQIK